MVRVRDKAIKSLAAILLLGLAAPCRADLTFVQIVQAQTNVGSDGFFGKTWVEISGEKMRLISGYAPKASQTKTKKDDARPLRLIQVLDLGATTLYLIDPSSKTYETRSLREVRYGELLKARLSNGAARYRVTASTVTLEPGTLRRKLIDTFAEHYHISVELTLEAPAAPGAPRSRPIRAAMEQDVWMAPLSGKLMKGLLDLMAFDSRYRALTGRDFTPLDFGTYQLPEAAAYLQVPASDIETLVLKVKRDLLSVPGYPLSSSVSWWKKTGGSRKAKTAEVKPAPKAEPPPMASRPPAPRPNPPRLQAPRKIFRPIDLRGSWRLIETEDKNDPRRARRTQARFFRRTERALRRHEGYRGFQEEMRRVIESLENYQLEETRGPEFGPRPPRRPDGAPPPEPPPAPPPTPPPAPEPEGYDRPRSPTDPAPFYEIFSELDSFEFRDRLPAEDFAPPAGFAPREIGIMAP